VLKRIFDILLSLFGLVVLLPFFLIIACWIAIDSNGGVFYKQQRIGRYGRPFYLLKFRTMRPDADKAGLLTVGKRDSRVTNIGYYLRKYKLDEFPQLVNVLKGDMSLVGPRPEVKRYVDQYTDEQRRVLNVRPGITDYASIKYIKESELLGQSADPEKTYVEEIMPEKVRINLQYVDSHGIVTDVKIILLTLLKIVR
jgi:lipopolysaccharide/colanic/teichoic acid biosynthesis glycosyltransferase